MSIPMCALSLMTSQQYVVVGVVTAAAYAEHQNMALTKLARQVFKNLQRVWHMTNHMTHDTDDTCIPAM